MSLDYPNIWKTLTDRFALGQWSIHGPIHWKNVEENGLSLARLNGADETVVRLFAVFHDSERENESYDPQHGQRAAALAADLHGELFWIEDEQLDLLCEACRLHHQGFTSDEVTIGTCWDADRMDLPRVGIRPDPQKMSTQEGHDYARLGPVALER
jgi:uncharacterized protein